MSEISEGSARTILIKIASYRDAELPRTLASAIAAATYPDRLRFAIVNQVGPETEQQLDHYSGDARFRVLQADWSITSGLGWARRQCDALYGGEDFAMQVDSHMRFDSGWDENLLAQWDALGDPRAVLSSYPSPYSFTPEGEEVRHAAASHLIRVCRVNEIGVPRLRGSLPAPGGIPSLLIAGCFMLAPGETCVTVKHLAEPFEGDEMVHSMRLFTHGYTVYNLTEIPLYHLYARHLFGGVHYWHEDLGESLDGAARHAWLRKRGTLMTRDVLFGDGGGDGLAQLGTERLRDDFLARVHDGGLLEPGVELPHSAAIG